MASFLLFVCFFFLSLLELSHSFRIRCTPPCRLPFRLSGEPSSDTAAKEAEFNALLNEMLTEARANNKNVDLDSPEAVAKALKEAQKLKQAGNAGISEEDRKAAAMAKALEEAKMSSLTEEDVKKVEEEFADALDDFIESMIKPEEQDSGSSGKGFGVPSGGFTVDEFARSKEPQIGVDLSVPFGPLSLADALKQLEAFNLPGYEKDEMTEILMDEDMSDTDRGETLEFMRRARLPPVDDDEQ
jgi:hypothetical protein